MKSAFGFIVRHPGSASALLVILVGVCAWGISRLQIDGSMTAFSSGPGSAAATLAELESQFPGLADTVVLFDAGDAAMAHAAADRLAGAIAADPKARELQLTIADDTVAEQERLAFVQDVLWPNLPWYVEDRAVPDFLTRLSPAGIEQQIRRTEMLIVSPGPSASRMAETLARDPLQLADFLPGIVSADEPSAARPNRAPQPDAMLVIRTGRSAGDTEYAQRVTHLIEGHIKQLTIPDVVTRITGPHAIAAFSARVIRREMVEGTTIAIVLIAGLFLVVHRSIRQALAVGLPIGCAMACAFGIFGWVSTEMTSLGTAGAAVLAGLAVDFGIHGVAGWSEPHDPQNATTNQARMSDWYRRMAMPLSVSAATSGFAFLVVAAVPMRAVRDFGILGALGIAAALAGALILVPAWMRMGVPNRKATEPVHPTGQATIAHVLQIILLRPRTGMTLVIAAVITLCTAAAIHGVQNAPFIDPSIASMHPMPNPPLQASNDLAASRGDGETILFQITASDESTAVNRARQLRTLLRAEPDVRDVESPATYFPKRKAMDLPDAETVENVLRSALAESALAPEAFDDYAAQVGAMLRSEAPPYNQVRDALPRSDRAWIQTASDGLTTMVLVMTIDRMLNDATDRRATIERLRLLAHGVDETGAITLAAFPAIAVDWRSLAEKWGPWILGIAAFGVCSMLIAAFRRPKDVLAALSPACIGLGVVIAGMLLVGPGWNAISMISLPLLIGLGIDDGIFAVTAARQVRTSSAARSIAPTAHAMLMTSLTTGIAFATLLSSSVPAFRHLGWVMIGGVGACFIGAIAVAIPIALHGVSSRNSAHEAAV